MLEGTLASNMRVGTMGAIAAKHLALTQAETIGFIGAGEQAKMHLLAMKSVRPSLRTCRVSSKTPEEEDLFIRQLAPILPDMEMVATGGDGEAATAEADIIVTATSAQAPLLKAAWMKPGAFYSHIGGWEDEYAVVKGSDKIICDDWETVKHRTQTLSRMFKEGELQNRDIYCDINALVAGRLPGRESEKERIYFNAVGLAYTDVAIAWAMYQRAAEQDIGTTMTLQETTIFEHPHIAEAFRSPVSV